MAVLIDGSNFLAHLDECDLGYPALAPLIRRLVGSDDLSYARFYSAPQSIEPYRSKWQSFRAANRHIVGLDWFLGFRNADGREKAIDVALAVDLIYGCANNHFDRVAMIGGDGDHTYALKVAKTTGRDLCVHLMPNQMSANLEKIGIRFRFFTVLDLIGWGVCERGKQAGVPLAHKAPSGHPDATPRLRGADANRVDE